MNKVRAVVFAFGGVFASTPSIASITVQSLVKLYHTENVAVTDHFYTISVSERDASISCCSFVDRGQAAWVLPSSPVDPAAKPFKRFYKGALQTEHFYSTSAADETAVYGLGYVLEGYEGAIYDTSVDSAQLAFHRLSKFDNYTGDLQHYYTTSYSEAMGMVNYGGWIYDTIAGYVWPVPSPSSSGTGLRLDVGTASGHWVGGPAVYDLSDPNWVYNGQCGGSVEVRSDAGVLLATVSPTSWNYGLLPGSAFQQGCYAGVYLTTGTLVNLTYGGMVARIGNFSSYTYQYFAPRRTSNFYVP